MPRNTRSETSKRNDASNSDRMQSSALTAEPLGLEKIYWDQFIERMSDTPDSKVALCVLTATYARNGWSFPKRLNEWTAAVMKSLAEGKKPFPMPRGKRMPTLEIVIFVKRLQNKGYELGQAKERAKTQFDVGMPAINKALRQYDITPWDMADL
jgi:hypothetical protein